MEYTVLYFPLLVILWSQLCIFKIHVELTHKHTYVNTHEDTHKYPVCTGSCLCKYTHTRCTCLWRTVVNLSCPSSRAIHLMFWNRVSHWPVFTNWARLAGQWALGIYLSLFPGLEVQVFARLFPMGSEARTQVLMPAGQVLYQPNNHSSSSAPVCTYMMWDSFPWSVSDRHETYVALFLVFSKKNEHIPSGR